MSSFQKRMNASFLAAEQGGAERQWLERQEVDWIHEGEGGTGETRTDNISS